VIALMLSWIVTAQFVAMIVTGIWIAVTSNGDTTYRRRLLALFERHPYLRGTSHLATLAAVVLAVLTLSGAA
jgi:hypothetical protein